MELTKEQLENTKLPNFEIFTYSYKACKKEGINKNEFYLIPYHIRPNSDYNNCIIVNNLKTATEVLTKIKLFYTTIVKNDFNSKIAFIKKCDELISYGCGSSFKIDSYYKKIN